MQVHFSEIIWRVNVKVNKRQDLAGMHASVYLNQVRLIDIEQV